MSAALEAWCPRCQDSTAHRQHLDRRWGTASWRCLACEARQGRERAARARASRAARRRAGARLDKAMGW